jgi:hypothetical protein
MRKDSELAHRVNRKTSLLLSPVDGTTFEKGLDVVPAKRLPGQKPPLRLALKIMAKARYKEIFLVPKLRIEP